MPNKPKPPRPGPGRPSTGRTITLGRVTPEVHALAADYADRHGLSLSDAIERAITRLAQSEAHHAED